MSDDPEQQYFSDGVTEDITTELSRFGSINVLARHSTFVLRDRSENIREAVAALGANYFLEGSIRRAGNRIRLTAQLVDVSSQKHVWAHRYDRELADVFAIQDELVHAIVATLIGRLESSILERALRKPPESLAAYDYYLRGLWCERKYDPEQIAEGRESLERAIALDPTFARAYALLATSMMMAVWLDGSFDMPSDAILRTAKKAVELDPTDGDCFAKLGIIHLDRQEHEEARRNLEKALNLNPHEPSTWSHFAWYLVTVGEPESALEYLDRREAIDPYPPNWHSDVRAEALYDLGRYEEAARVLEQKTAPYAYNYGQLAACYGQLGRKEEAARSWEKFVERSPEATLSSVGDGNCYLRQVDSDHWLEGLLKAELSD
jgi:TolB-like protein